MLRVARHRQGGDLVHWIEGDAGSLERVAAYLAIVTGHVAQVIADKGMWRRTLAGAHRALRPGGHIAFESRNRSAQGVAEVDAGEILPADAGHAVRQGGGVAAAPRSLR